MFLSQFKSYKKRIKDVLCQFTYKRGEKGERLCVIKMCQLNVWKHNYNYEIKRYVFELVQKKTY